MVILKNTVFFLSWPFWILGAVHKLRLQEEGGRWSKKLTFCNLLYQRKCKRRGVEGQKKPNLVNIVCERPLKHIKMRLFSFDHFSRPGDNRCKRGGLKDLELWSLLCITNSFRFILMQPNINVMWFRIGLFMLWSSLGHQDYFDFKVLLQPICNLYRLFNLKATCNSNLLK